MTAPPQGVPVSVVVHVQPGTWPACVDATADLLAGRAGNADVLLLHVIDHTPARVASAARTGLLGRGTGADPGGRILALGEDAAQDLLTGAARRLRERAAGTTVRLELRRGAAEREVVAACAGAHYLVLGRDGDLSRLGPRSLDRTTRFVLDHAPCQVLLVWPTAAPGLGSIPPPPSGSPAPPERRHRPAGGQPAAG